jgi:naphthalene 1,2-dioxygenase ferredoxin reductase component
MRLAARLRQHAALLAIEPGAAILEAAPAQGVPSRDGCRSGNCGACKSRLHDGAVEL